jgi:hypothetical protein
MRIHTNKGKTPKLIIEFESEQERLNTIDYLDSIVFDDLPTFANSVRGYPVFNVPAQNFEEIIAYLPADCTSITGTQGEPFAVWWDMSEIYTDPKRFQNRTNAFSELSAEQVASNYDENKLDPVIVWRDPKNQKIYILSGHSRHEGMRRRREPYMPIRFFIGTEGEAIKFAKIDANRVANKENLIEDLQAYKLSRDGDMSKGITPMNKADLKQAFKGKESKLEAWSFLSPKGKFLEALSKEDNISQFPRIQSFATWAGKLRKENSKISDLMENDMFNYFYHSNRQRKIDFQRFRELVLERLSYGADRLFPECEDIPCKPIKDFKEVGQNRELYKELSNLSKQISQLNERRETNNPVLRVYTDEEKKALLSVRKQIQSQIQRLQRDLNIIEKQPSLLGPDEQNEALLRLELASQLLGI